MYLSLSKYIGLIKNKKQLNFFYLGSLISFNDGCKNDGNAQVKKQYFCF